MRIKGSSKETIAISGEAERALVAAIAFLALFTWAKVADLAAQEPAAKMGKCGEMGVLCLSDLPYAPGERFQVSISQIEER